MRRIAIVGSGISGLAAAYRLAPNHRVTLFEADARFGGHANTVDVTLDGVTHGVDTGFLVLNERTYPHLLRLFAELDVPLAPSDMSFSVQVPDTGFEWSGSDLNTVFAQRSNLVKPSFWRMLADILRFNRMTTALAERGAEAQLRQPIGEFLRAHRFSSAFRDGYFLPMIGCIWSCPTDQMLAFPIATMIRFCHNHGLIQVANRPRWFTVRGGSRQYVQKIIATLADARAATPVRQVRREPGADGRLCAVVVTDHGAERFDDVVLACHAPQSMSLLADATEEERRVLGGLRTHANRAVLHTDTAVLPRRPRAWAAWNYERAAHDDRERAGVCLHYLINRLQPLPWRTPVVVSLNPVRPIASEHVLAEFDYAHPVFDQAAIDAQTRLGSIQGVRHTWFCGAWTRYGFHEDGLMSALAVVDKLAAQAPLASAPLSRAAA